MPFLPHHGGDLLSFLFYSLSALAVIAVHIFQKGNLNCAAVIRWRVTVCPPSQSTAFQTDVVTIPTNLVTPS